MKKITILLITDTYTPQGGGAERHFFALKERLERSSSVSVSTLGFGPSPKEDIRTKVIRETSSPLIRQFWRICCNPVKYFQIRRFIRRVKPDVIHLHNINKYTPSLLLAVAGYPVVQTVHDYGLVCPSLCNLHTGEIPCTTGMRRGCIAKHRRDYSWPVYTSMLFSFWRKARLLKRTVKQFLVPSPGLKETMASQGFKNVTLFPHFLDFKHRKPSSGRLHPHQILYVGALEQNKGVHLLLEALPSIKAKVPDVTLVIAGEGSYKPALQDTVKKLGLDGQVTFLGYVPDISPLLQRSAVLAAPSLVQESFGLAVAEAMSFAKPVVCSKRGALPWLVEHGKTGLVFDPLKKNDLANALMILFKDKKKAAAYGKQGQKKIRSFPSPDAYIKKLLLIYRALG